VVPHLAEARCEEDDCEQDGERDQRLRRPVAQALRLELARELIEAGCRCRDVEVRRNAP
jgi:hypothetical protein